MTASIIINQTGASAGTAGRSRKDLTVGNTVTCSNATAESSYAWTLVDVPIRSALSRGTTGTGSTFQFVPDVKGTYLVSLTVNNSTLPEDTQKVFGAVPSTLRGWRYLADGERSEDNTEYAGLGFPSNINTRGWATEMDLQLEDLELATDTILSGGTGELGTVRSLQGTVNQLIETIDTVEVAGGFSFNAGILGTHTASFEAIGSITVAGAGDGNIYLYDLGAPGTPEAPVLRSTVQIANATAPNVVQVLQALTVSASPGVDADEIYNTERIYEIRAELSGATAGDSLKILSAGMRFN